MSHRQDARDAADRDEELTEAYAEGRKDEREEWLPMLEAMRDMLSGWIYIRGTHGDLYGVGWDRAQSKAEAAIARVTT